MTIKQETESVRVIEHKDNKMTIEQVFSKEIFEQYQFEQIKDILEDLEEIKLT